jgi:outer membrane protein assembly factor BamB
MKQVFSSPVIVGDRLYIGEGFHQDDNCKLYCLSLDKGEKLWEYQTASHTESTPCVVDGRVYCGAGDDGLFCLTADKGDKVWNFPSFHIDASPVVVGDSVYAGCGIGDTFKTTALLCLDMAQGKLRWRWNTDLPVWGRPMVAGGPSSGFVYVGTGNGRLNESDEKPAGAVRCLRARDGEEVWKRKMSDGVLAPLAGDRRRLFFGCRDGHFYCLRRSDGAILWRRDMGSPVVAGATLDVDVPGETSAERVYGASIEGFLACMEPTTGSLIWSFDLAENGNAKLEVISTPALEVRTDAVGKEVRRLYIGLTMVSTGRTGELHCYEEQPLTKE